MDQEAVGADSLVPVNANRVQKIFGVMSNSSRMEVLRILNNKGSLTYSELKAMVGLKTKRDSGRFSYHLRQLLRLTLVDQNKMEKRYSITNLGRRALSLARQMEERSIIESSQKYVRTTHQSIEEFNHAKITDSLVREGRLSREAAQKITEEVENRIYKYGTEYLTGPLIREITNTVLLENGHEDLRDRMTRLGMPAHDVYKMMNNVNGDGSKSLMLNAGRSVFAEYLLTNMLPKDVADMHLSGEIHISNISYWPLVPDTTFVDAADALDGARAADSRTPGRADGTPKSLLLAAALEGVSGEASQECVVGGFEGTDLAGRDVYNALVSAHSNGRDGPDISLRVPLSSDAAAYMLDAYDGYLKCTANPRVGLVVDADGRGVDEFAGSLAAMSMRGGRIAVSSGQAASNGITGGTPPTPAKMHSVAVNLPRLALESSQDESYFRAKLALLIDSIMVALEKRGNDVLDMTHRGLNPFLGRTLGRRDGESMGLVVNLVGLGEAVSSIMKYEGREAHVTGLKAIATAAQRVAKRGRSPKFPVAVCMTSSPGSARLVDLDEERYGRNSIPGPARRNQYAQGCLVDAREAAADRRDAKLLRVREMGELLDGGMLASMLFGKGTAQEDLQEAIRAAAGLFGFVLRAA